MVRPILVPFLSLGLACSGGGEPGGDSGPGSGDAPALDGPAADGPAGCGRVGEPCSGGCDDDDDDLVCRQGAADGFCAPNRAGCDGFSGMDCLDPQHLCLRITSSTDGVCLTQTEKDCVCARSPEALEDC